MHYFAANTRMRYPSCFVLVHGDVEAEVLKQTGGPPSSSRRQLQGAIEQGSCSDASSTATSAADLTEAMVCIAKKGL